MSAGSWKFSEPLLFQLNLWKNKATLKIFEASFDWLEFYYYFLISCLFLHSKVLSEVSSLVDDTERGFFWKIDRRWMRLKILKFEKRKSKSSKFNV